MIKKCLIIHECFSKKTLPWSLDHLKHPDGILVIGFGCSRKPFFRSGNIPWYPLPRSVHDAEDRLGVDLPAPRRSLQPILGLLAVVFHPAAEEIHGAENSLGITVAGLGSFCDRSARCGVIVPRIGIKSARVDRIAAFTATCCKDEEEPTGVGGTHWGGSKPQRHGEKSHRVNWRCRIPLHLAVVQIAVVELAIEILRHQKR